MKTLPAFRLVLAPLFLVSSVASPLAAQIGTIVSPPALANSNGFTDTSSDFAPSLVCDGGDVFACVFVTTDPTLTNGGDTDIFWIRSRDLGVTWSAPAPISASFLTDSGVTSTDVEPALATDGNSRVVVWASSRSSPTGNTGIHSSSGSMTETLWTVVVPINAAFATDAVDDSAPCIAGANDTFITVWERTDGGFERDLWFARSTDAGSTWSAPARIDAASASDTGSDTHARIATDGAGHWVVVYESLESHFSTGTDSEIYAYRSSDDGITWQGPTLVNTTAATDGGAYDTEPSVAVDRASGTWLCTWKTFHTFGGLTGGDSEIVSSKSTNLGLSWASPVIVNTDFATDQSTSTGDMEPFVYADQSGHFLVSWTRTLLDDNDFDLRAARSDSLGNSWSAQEFIDVDASLDSGHDSHSQIVSDGRGHWVSAWQSSDNVSPPFGTDMDVLVSRFLIPRADFQADFCYGYTETGNSARCPCGNDAPITAREGCRNSTGSGAKVFMVGAFNISNPTESMSYLGVPPGAPVLLFQGTGQFSFGTGIPLGDGMLCVGGAIDRLGVSFANGAGNGVKSFVPVGVTAGAIRFYQGWYRDAATFCTTATFNLSNAYATVWQP
ncbi:MAG: exo-alpha-sialidase [Planctomycetes bacterium]|nr:exo-alpha-sialidase [Planctomycetota bacterium]